jgi:hypothetical protein
MHRILRRLFGSLRWLPKLLLTRNEVGAHDGNEQT